MDQSKRSSLIESFLNQFSGLVISLLLFQYIIGPYMLEITPTWSDNISVTLVFTLVSVVRSYLFRRLFNRLGNSQKKVCKESEESPSCFGGGLTFSKDFKEYNAIHKEGGMYTVCTLNLLTNERSTITMSFADLIHLLYS